MFILYGKRLINDCYLLMTGYESLQFEVFLVQVVALKEPICYLHACLGLLLGEAFSHFNVAIEPLEQLRSLVFEEFNFIFCGKNNWLRYIINGRFICERHVILMYSSYWCLL